MIWVLLRLDCCRIWKSRLSGDRSARPGSVAPSDDRVSCRLSPSLTCVRSTSAVSVPGNYIHVSRRLAEETGAAWANQFDNTANREAHRRATGPEIIRQTGGRLDAFTCAVGTGGTLAGIALALKAHDPAIRITLADPHGSGLHAWITEGTPRAEGSSITEGIGQGRVTANLDGAPIDDAVRIGDAETLEVLFNLVRHDGLVLGGSAGLNVAAAMRVARALGPGHSVVTVLCDLGARYQSKLYNPAFLAEQGLPTPPWMREDPTP